MWDVSCMCLWSPLRAAGLLRLCVARPFRLPVSLSAGLVTLSYTKGDMMRHDVSLHQELCVRSEGRVTSLLQYQLHLCLMIV